MPSESLVPAVVSFGVIVALWVLFTLHTMWLYLCSKKANEFKKKKVHVKPLLRYSAILYLLFWSIAYIASLALTTLALSDVRFFYNDRSGYDILIITIMITGSIGFMSFYTFTLGRLYYTFRETMFKVRKRIVIIYFIIALIISILFCCYGSSYYLFTEHFFGSHKYLRYIVMSAACISVISNTIIASSLIYLFSNKLVQLALLQRRTINNRNVLEIALTDKQQTMIEIVTKQVLLNVTAIVSFNILIPIAIIIYVWLLHHNVFTYLATIFCGYIFHTIEMFCVVLSLVDNKKYYACCCRLCHNGCDSCCQSIAKKRLQKTYYIEQDLDVDLSYQAL
eukprot:173198_1